MLQANRGGGPARAIRILHGSILVGLLVIASMLGLMLRLMEGPVLGEASVIGLVLAGLGFVFLAVAVGLLHARLRGRGSEQPPDAYWSDANARTAALILWFVVECAGLLGSVGYFLTGAASGAAVAVLAILVLFWLRPARIEAAGGG